MTPEEHKQVVHWIKDAVYEAIFIAIAIMLVVLLQQLHAWKTDMVTWRLSISDEAHDALRMLKRIQPNCHEGEHHGTPDAAAPAE